MPALLKTFLTWIITLVTGALILTLLNGLDDKFIIIYFSLGLGSVCSLPGMILYHIIALNIYRIPMPLINKKLLMALSAVIIIGISGIIIFSDKSFIALIALMIYGPAMILCAFIFDYTPNVKLRSGAKQEEYNSEPNRTLNMILLLCVIGIIYSASTFITLFSRYSAWNTSILISPYVLPALLFIFLYIAAFVLLWRRSSKGWHLQVVLSVISILGTALSFVAFGSSATFLVNKVFILALTGSLLFLLCKKNIRDYFNISNQQMQMILCIAVAITLAIFIPIAGTYY